MQDEILSRTVVTLMLILFTAGGVKGMWTWHNRWYTEFSVLNIPELLVVFILGGVTACLIFWFCVLFVLAIAYVFLGNSL